MQFLAALLIVASIIFAKLGDAVSASSANSVPAVAFLMALVVSGNSVGAAVYTESLFKTGTDKFLEQQFWLYLYGLLVTLLVHIATSGGFIEAFYSLAGWKFAL